MTIHGSWMCLAVGQKVQDKPLLGPDISMGTRQEVMAYLRDMADTVVVNDDLGKCEAKGVDQIIHNVLAYR